MFSVRAMLFVLFICFWYSYATAEPRDLQTCESHLNKYRKFLLQAILSFEDVCDGYNVRNTLTVDVGLPPQISFFGRYQPPDQKAEVWSFFKLLMAQFNDVEFTNTIRDAVVDRCRIKLQQQQQQRDEKRNSVVLGKKQRFHSWGGKRNGGAAVIQSGLSNNDLEQDHNDDINLSF